MSRNRGSFAAAPYGAALNIGANVRLVPAFRDHNRPGHDFPLLSDVRAPTYNWRWFCLLDGSAPFNRRGTAVKSSRFIVAFALAGMMLPGCIPESQHPISPLADAEQDTRLNGVWTVEEADCVRYLHVGA